MPGRTKKQEEPSQDASMEDALPDAQAEANQDAEMVEEEEEEEEEVEPQRVRIVRNRRAIHVHFEQLVDLYSSFRDPLTQLRPSSSLRRVTQWETH